MAPSNSDADIQPNPQYKRPEVHSAETGGNALQYASHNLKLDKKVIIAAVNQNGTSWQ